MILGDFLSRIKANNSDQHGLIPIAFNFIEPVTYPTHEFQEVYFNPKDGKLLQNRINSRICSYQILQYTKN